MSYVVTEPCIKCKFTDCVEVCPVNCFYEGEQFLVINPAECIDCGACEPVCPTKAIFPESDLPEKYSGFRDINAKYARVWSVISEKRAPLPGAESFKRVEGKLGLINLDEEAKRLSAEREAAAKARSEAVIQVKALETELLTGFSQASVRSWVQTCARFGIDLDVRVLKEACGDPGGPHGLHATILDEREALSRCMGGLAEDADVRRLFLLGFGEKWPDAPDEICRVAFELSGCGPEMFRAGELPQSLERVAWRVVLIEERNPELKVLSKGSRHLEDEELRSLIKGILGSTPRSTWFGKREEWARAGAVDPRIERALHLLLESAPSSAQLAASSGVVRAGRSKRLIDAESLRIVGNLEEWGEWDPEWPEDLSRSEAFFWKTVKRSKVRVKTGFVRARRFDPDSNRGFAWSVVYEEDTGRALGIVTADSTGDESESTWERADSFDSVVAEVKALAQDAQAQVDDSM